MTDQNKDTIVKTNEKELYNKMEELLKNSKVDVKIQYDENKAPVYLLIEGNIVSIMSKLMDDFKFKMALRALGL